MYLRCQLNLIPVCPPSPSQWFNRTDYPIFAQYQRYRRLHPLQPFYILHPRFEWQIWQRIQDNMAEPIQKNPPSSGMLGMVFSHFLFMLQTAFITHTNVNILCAFTYQKFVSAT